MFNLQMHGVVLRGIAWLALSLLCGSALPQAYPSKPVRLLVGFPAGGGADITARLVAERLTTSLAQPVIVENRPGASTAIATDWVAKAAPDGHILLLMSSSTVIQSALRTDLPYDLLRDLVPISMVAQGPFVLVVHPSVPMRMVGDVIAVALSRGSQLTYASDGIGSAFHLAMELLFSVGKIKGVTHVPYKGGAAAATAVASGQTDMAIIGISGALPLMSSNKLRGLAVTTGSRSSLLPQLPTMSESGLVGYERSTWYGVIVPARTQKEIVARLGKEIGLALSVSDVKEALRRQGLEPTPSTPDRFAQFMQDELSKDRQLAKAIGLRHQ